MDGSVKAIQAINDMFLPGSVCPCGTQSLSILATMIIRIERQIGRSYFRRVVCVDVCDEMCKTFMLTLVLYIDFVYIGDGFDLI